MVFVYAEQFRYGKTLANESIEILEFARKRIEGEKLQLCSVLDPRAQVL